MSHTTGHDGWARHPGNLGWLLDKVADFDVARGPDYQYRIGVGDDAILCTDEVEALAQPARARVNWVPPLVRLRRDGLVELTTAGRETLGRLAKEFTPPEKAVERKARRRTTTPVFQAA
jgi:hypothetical protein